eukprot:Gregarina_sp_Poly_1__10226@NODE_70_length_16104_cov_129_894619_g60_i0_p4_GENE_NODE_70_length_16104_cov_129_894619_g60_i0NODE_70_length_16104_cov_129_894619_g60_i0_p4_ORF_typecomplete_len478_score45_73Lactonase/PF10282_9/1_3e02Lactonase/PF10282_9/0_31_NODE_70_length_16104_cov_129_894619_g60_i083609793
MTEPKKPMATLVPIDDFSFDWPLGRLAIAEDGSRLAVASATLESGNIITVLRENGLDPFQVPSLFPPSSVALSPGNAEILAVGGEAIALWDSSEHLRAYYVPEQFSGSPDIRLRASIEAPAAVANDSPVWSVPHLDWSRYNPQSLLVCQRSGALCVYPIDRLPTAQRAREGGVLAVNAPSQGIFTQIARSIASKILPTSPDKTMSPESSWKVTHSKNGPLYQIVASPFVPVQRTPRVLTKAPQPASNFFTSAHYFGNNNTVVAARNGNDQLSVFDTRSKQENPTWDPALTGISKICIEPGPSPNYVLGLNRQAGAICVYDHRNMTNGKLDRIHMHTVNSLFTEDIMINDLSWSDLNSQSILFALQHKIPISIESWSPTIASTASDLLLGKETKRPTMCEFQDVGANGKKESSMVATAVQSVGHNAIALTRMMGHVTTEGEGSDLVSIPPAPNCSSPIKHMRCIANKPWRLTIARLGK